MVKLVYDMPINNQPINCYVQKIRSKSNTAASFKFNRFNHISFAKTNMAIERKNDKRGNFKIFYSLDLAAKLGFSIAIPLIIFILIGRFLDGYFNTSPIFVLSGLVVGLASSICEIFRSVLPILDNGKNDGEKDKG